MSTLFILSSRWFLLPLFLWLTIRVNQCAGVNGNIIPGLSVGSRCACSAWDSPPRHGGSSCSGAATADCVGCMRTNGTGGAAAIKARGSWSTATPKEQAEKFEHVCVYSSPALCFVHLCLDFRFWISERQNWFLLSKVCQVCRMQNKAPDKLTSLENCVWDQVLWSKTRVP